MSRPRFVEVPGHGRWACDGACVVSNTPGPRPQAEWLSSDEWVPSVAEWLGRERFPVEDGRAFHERFGRLLAHADAREELRFSRDTKRRAGTVLVLSRRGRVFALVAPLVRGWERGVDMYGQPRVPAAGEAPARKARRK